MKKVAKEILKVAKELMATEIEVGGPYKVDMNAVKRWDSSPPYINLVMKEIKNGGGFVDVKEVKEEKAGIYAHDTHSWMIGLVWVPASALIKA